MKFFITNLFFLTILSGCGTTQLGVVEERLQAIPSSIRFPITDLGPVAVKMNRDPNSVKAIGGIVTKLHGHTLHTFKSSGTFTNLSLKSVEVLIVGADGGNGSRCGDLPLENGRQGKTFISFFTLRPGDISVVVGAGGISGTLGAAGQQGGSSSFGLTVVNGGLGGAGQDFTNSACIPSEDNSRVGNGLVVIRYKNKE